MPFLPISYSSHRKWLVFLATSIGLIGTPGFARPLLKQVTTTPYDAQMKRVRAVITATNCSSGEQLSLTTVNQWIITLRAMPYRFTRQWKTPAEVKSAAAADCKGKAVALYQKMRATGATNLLLVIGKHHADAVLTHAWLEWQTSDGVYILDPTFNWSAIKAVDCHPFSYIAFYAYEGENYYRAAAPVLIAPNRSATNPPAPAEFVPFPVRSRNLRHRH